MPLRNWSKWTLLQVCLKYFIKTAISGIRRFQSNVQHSAQKVEDNARRFSLSFATCFLEELVRDEFSSILKIRSG